MKVNSQDLGHRHGNFHNYYSFHPTSSRLETMMKGGNRIFQSIVQHYCSLSSLTSTSSTTTSLSENNEENRPKEKPSNPLLLESCEKVNDTSPTKKRPRLSVDKKDKEHDSDRHEKNKAVSEDDEIKHTNSNSNNSALSSFTYCDLGCNEGDLTKVVVAEIYDILSVYQSKSSFYSEKQNTDDNTTKMYCLGLDIDPVLIQRASSGSSSVEDYSKKKENEEQSRHHLYKFQVCDLCNSKEHESAYESFFEQNFSDGNRKRFDLTSVFSTTMWIHVHAGDDGLREFLKRCCEYTEMLLIEPQASKSYRNINVRLRKMNRPEVEHTGISALKMRANIEYEIDSIVVDVCGFEKLDLTRNNNNENGSGSSPQPISNNNKKGKGSGGFDRKLLLYKRKK